MLKEFLECGLVQNTHGVKGMLRIGHRCDSPEVFCALKTVYAEKNGGYTPYKVKSASQHGAVILLALEGIDTMEDALKLKGKSLYANRADLPIAEGAFFIADLIGLPVIDAVSGKKYGELTDVVNRGASDVYEIDTASGRFEKYSATVFVLEMDCLKKPRSK